MMKSFFSTAIVAALICGISACHEVDDDRIPNFAVSINLADAGQWNTYGVSGFGSYQRFIFTNNLRIPAGFPYTGMSATGYGGVLLIAGMDPFSGETLAPLAYDLACPVEMKADIRVEIEGEMYDAVCPQCGSHYDVVMGGGSPKSGIAAAGDHKYGLRRYKCIPAGGGGYSLTNK